MTEDLHTSGKSNGTVPDNMAKMVYCLGQMTL